MISRTAENNVPAPIFPLVSVITEGRTDIKSVPWTEVQDRARRNVKGFFLGAYTLWRGRSISRRALLQIIDVDGVALLFSVVEPMERILNDQYDWRPFYEIMRIMGPRRWAAIRVRTQTHKTPIVFLPEIQPKP